MTLGELIPDVRKLVNDTVPEYRWLDADIAGYLRDSLVRLQSVRPTTKLEASGDGGYDDIAYPPDLTIYALPPTYLRWRQAFIYYAAARCLEIDAADTVNQSLAVDFMAKAEARFVS